MTEPSGGEFRKAKLANNRSAVIHFYITFGTYFRLIDFAKQNRPYKKHR